MSRQQHDSRLVGMDIPETISGGGGSSNTTKASGTPSVVAAQASAASELSRSRPWAQASSYNKEERHAVQSSMLRWRWKRTLSGSQLPQSLTRGGVDDLDAHGLEQWLRRWVTIDPESKRKFSWDCLIIVFVLYTAVVIPMRAAFTAFPASPGIDVLDIILDVLFVVDIWLSFRTGYYREDGQLVVGSSLIAGKYCRSWFTVDLLATFPYELVVGEGEDAEGLKLISALKCIRLLRLGRLYKMMKRHSGSGANLLGIASLILTLALLCHWIACLWMVIETASAASDGVSWLLLDSNVADSPLEMQYPVVLYMSMLMIAGDGVKTYTSSEGWFAVCVTLLGITALALLVSKMAVYQQNLSARDQAQQEVLSSITDELTFLAIPGDLQTRVLNHYDYMFQNRHFNMEGSWLARFPPHLRAECCSYLHLEAMANTAIFHFCGRGFLAALVRCWGTETYMKREFIFRQGDFGSSMFYVAQGAVLLCKDGPDPELKGGEQEGGPMGFLNKTMSFKRRMRNDSLVRAGIMGGGASGDSEDEPEEECDLHFFHEVQPGAFVGELAAFFVQPRMAGAVAEGVVVCHTLCRDDIIHIANDFPEEQEHIASGLMGLPQLSGNDIYWDGTMGKMELVKVSRGGEANNAPRSQDDAADETPGSGRSVKFKRAAEMSAIRAGLKDLVKRFDALDEQ